MNIKNIIWSVVGGIIGAAILTLGVTLVHSPKNLGALANCSAGYTCYNYLDVLNNIVIDGVLTQTGGAAAVAIFPGTTLINNAVYSYTGYSATYTTSQQITTAAYCANASSLVPQSVVSGITITLPAASTTFVGCGAVAGSYAFQPFDNESSVAVTLATSTGGANINFYVASTTGGPKVIAPYPPIIPATTTVMFTGQYVDSTHLNLYLDYYTRAY